MFWGGVDAAGNMVALLQPPLWPGVPKRAAAPDQGARSLTFGNWTESPSSPHTFSLAVCLECMSFPAWLRSKLETWKHDIWGLMLQLKGIY